MALGMGLLRRLFDRSSARPKKELHPEATYRVEWDAEEISCTWPSGERRSVAWEKLRSVRIRTTDAGPFTADVFWVLEGNGSFCVVPQAARGEERLLARLQELPGFDSEAVIAAMSSTDNAEFTCWTA
jgi:hypothetical protein